MKVILYMATSVNGNITRGKNDSDWVDKADWEMFHKTITDARVMIMGSETYKQFSDDFPQKGALNIVVTNNKELLSKNIEGALFTNLKPNELLDKLSKDGYKQVALIGGQTLNTSFIKENLVNEIYVDIHPYLIGEGLRLFGEINDYFKKLKLLDVTKLKNDLVLLHYKAK
jgi:dihydrofolate reductase